MDPPNPRKRADADRERHFDELLKLIARLIATKWREQQSAPRPDTPSRTRRRGPRKR